MSATLARWNVRDVFASTAGMGKSWLLCHARSVSMLTMYQASFERSSGSGFEHRDLGVVLQRCDCGFSCRVCVAAPRLPGPVSAVRNRRVAVVHVCPPRHPLAVCSCYVVVSSACLHAHDIVSLSSRCVLCGRRSVAGLPSRMMASGASGLSGCVVPESLTHGVVLERLHAVC
jgi:hypothetical protein